MGLTPGDHATVTVLSVREVSPQIADSAHFERKLAGTGVAQRGELGNLFRLQESSE